MVVQRALRLVSFVVGRMGISWAILWVAHVVGAKVEMMACAVVV